MLLDTLRRESVTLTNPGKARVDFSWAWQTPAAGGALAAVAERSSPEPERSVAALAGALRGSLKGGEGRFAGVAAGSLGAPSSKAAPPRPAFDILPIRGSLAPGERQEVEVSFYGYPGVRAAATAVCHVEGGPDYQVRAFVPVGRWLGLHGEFKAHACSYMRMSANRQTAPSVRTAR